MDGRTEAVPEIFVRHLQKSAKCTEQQAPAQSGWKARTVVSSAPYER